MHDDATMTWPGLDEEGRTPTSELDERYVDLGLIAVGGMGEVRRVRDTWLDTTWAMKVLSPTLAGDLGARRRFIEEAQLMARLQHPGIVAVHDRGELAGGRLWYTMTEVQGITFSERIASLERPVPTPLLRQVLHEVEQVARTLHVAHEAGVVHRDIKPSNVMLGRFGEVLVMDWGIARTPETGRRGVAVGTPQYMAPEQVLGEEGTPCDVYALGGVLHEVLTGARPMPLVGAAAVARLRRGPPPVHLAGSVPRDLRLLVQDMLRADPDARPPAQVVADRIRAWRDGSAKAEEARRVTREAASLRSRIAKRLEQAAALRLEARVGLLAVPMSAPSEARHAAWALEDEADDLERTARVEEAVWLQRLGSALHLDPECGPALATLADHYAQQLEHAARSGRDRDAAALEVHLRRYDVEGRHARLLRGLTRLSLTTVPEGATVRAFRVVSRSRTLVEELHGDLGRTPLQGVELPHGSWVLVVAHPGREPVRVPVLLERGADRGQAEAVVLPPAGSIPEGFSYVPAGRFRCGGDPEAMEAFPGQDVWLDGYLIQDRHVTVAEYMVFLADLARRGEDWQDVAPRTRDGGILAERRGASIVPLPFPGQPMRAVDVPITGVSAGDAMAYAAWRSERDGVVYALPTELQWEKAARGVDGRIHPWGNTFDPTRANLPSGGPDALAPSVAGQFPLDVGPWGTRDVAGNVMDWCGNAWAETVADVVPVTGPLGEDTLIVGRGGSYVSGSSYDGRCASRRASPSGMTWSFAGFRLVRSLR